MAMNFQWPFISVVIPAFNEERHIENCIRSTQNQDYPGVYEIIVVDNASTDQTQVKAANLGVKVVHEPKRGLCAARQAGLEASQGEIIAYIDADSLAPSNWLKDIAIKFQEDPKIVGISGFYRFFGIKKWRHRCFFWIFFHILEPLLFLFLACLRQSAFRGANFAVKKAAVYQVGGFDTSILFYGEDLNIADRLQRVGKIKQIHSIVSSSGRRYNQNGIVLPMLIYTFNYIWMFFFKEPFTKGVDDLSEQHQEKIIPLNPLRWHKRLAFALLVIGLFFYGAFHPTNFLFGKVIHSGPTDQRLVALTFDDGPSLSATPAVLKILKENQIKATFFLIGANAERHPEIAKQILADGHLIANHTYEHQRLKALGWNQFLEDAKKNNEILFGLLGVRPKYFRPPGGFRTPWMLYQLKNHGFIPVMWNDMTSDYRIKVDSNAIVSDLIGDLSAGAIIVLHDGLNLELDPNRQNTLQALPILIHEIKKRGFQFVTLDKFVPAPAYFK
ncbi:MAG: polysaccharide deacetylase family protein [Deltaproteobacteria bacterium]|nr:polysaccharide deacetylase family protein [Deltaproteobacteria bacterium]